MALISELNAVTAETLNIPLPTVAIYSRVLREGGLLSKKGRGRGAAHATPLDAARLLIALLATPSPSQAADCAADFGALVEHDAQEIYVGKKGVKDAEREPFTIGEAYGLQPQHTLEQAFAAIIAGFSEERFARSYAAGARVIEPARQYFAPQLRIAVFDTALGAQIDLNQHVYRYGFAAFVNCGVEQLNRAADEFESVARKYRRGIESTRSVRMDKLQAIARVVNGRECDLNAFVQDRSK